MDNKAVKYDKNGKTIPLSDEDRKDILYWETAAKKTVDDVFRENTIGNTEIIELNNL